MKVDGNCFLKHFVYEGEIGDGAIIEKDFWVKVVFYNVLYWLSFKLEGWVRFGENDL